MEIYFGPSPRHAKIYFTYYQPVYGDSISAVPRSKYQLLRYSKTQIQKSAYTLSLVKALWF